MGLTMRERKAVIKKTAAGYRRSSKKQKAKFLDEFVETTGYIGFAAQKLQKTSQGTL